MNQEIPITSQRTKWTQEENDCLINLVQKYTNQHGQISWKDVARGMIGVTRSIKACMCHYNTQFKQEVKIGKIHQQKSLTEALNELELCYQANFSRTEIKKFVFQNDIQINQMVQLAQRKIDFIGKILEKIKNGEHLFVPHHKLIEEVYHQRKTKKYESLNSIVSDEQQEMIANYLCTRNHENVK